ncbi:MAG: FKBP-type peptidyl-prolyl cis-trans isomerase [Bacteroidales bacterium]
MEFVKIGKYVEASYILTVGEEEEIMESVPKEKPLAFVFGAEQMLESFENEIKGLKSGDKFDFRISSAEAFGDYEDSRVQELSKDIFCVDGKFDSENIVPGKTLQMLNSDGNRFNGSVIEVKEDIVIMDFNHPLAGENLHFTGEILLVRDATPEEINPPSCGGNCCGECGDDDCDGSQHGHCKDGCCHS